MNYFEKLNQIDVSEHIEKKGQFNYLAWAWAHEQMSKLHPEAIIKVKVNEHGFPAFYAPNGQAMVWVTVEIENVVRGQPYPVLDYRNKPVDDPDIFTINTSLQRALVKAISLHGLGLYIYAGEDLPPDIGYSKDEKKTYDTLLEGEDNLAFWLYLHSLADEKKVALHNSFEKGQITKKKKQAGEKEKAGSMLYAELEGEMIDRIEENDYDGLHEIGLELGDYGKKLAFSQLTPEQQHKAKEMKQYRGR